MTVTEPIEQQILQHIEDALSLIQNELPFSIFSEDAMAKTVAEIYILLGDAHFKMLKYAEAVNDISYSAHP